jgi:hypothetical protein
MEMAKGIDASQLSIKNSGIKLYGSGAKIDITTCSITTLSIMTLNITTPRTPVE